MDKQKLNKLGIIGFVVFILIFASFSGYVFFNNTSNLAISIRSNDEQLKRDVAVNEALTKILLTKNDSIDALSGVIDIITNEQKQNNTIISEKNIQIIKLIHEKDSLASLILKYKWSDIEPVNSKRQK
jgi:hypothetical protein